MLICQINLRVSENWSSYSDLPGSKEIVQWLPVSFIFLSRRRKWESSLLFWVCSCSINSLFPGSLHIVMMWNTNNKQQNLIHKFLSAFSSPGWTTPAPLFCVGKLSPKHSRKLLYCLCCKVPPADIGVVLVSHEDKGLWLCPVFWRSLNFLLSPSNLYHNINNFV